MSISMPTDTVSKMSSDGASCSDTSGALKGPPANKEDHKFKRRLVPRYSQCRTNREARPLSSNRQAIRPDFGRLSWKMLSDSNTPAGIRSVFEFAGNLQPVDLAMHRLTCLVEPSAPKGPQCAHNTIATMMHYELSCCTSSAVKE